MKRDEQMRRAALAALGEVAAEGSSVRAGMIGDYIGHLEALVDEPRVERDPESRYGKMEACLKHIRDGYRLNGDEPAAEWLDRVLAIPDATSQEQRSGAAEPFVIRASHLIACPECGRAKARSADDCANGLCPKWYAVRDSEAQVDCERYAGSAPKKRFYEAIDTLRAMGFSDAADALADFPSKEQRS